MGLSIIKRGGYKAVKEMELDSRDSLREVAVNGNDHYGFNEHEMS